MRDERGLDFDREDVDVADLEHVIAAPRVNVMTVGVDRVLVSAARPGGPQRR